MENLELYSRVQIILYKIIQNMLARPRSFDTQAVLDAASAEFRVHGFADTSTEQLCEAAGVRRSSLYNTFTSKEELFVQALQRYTEVMMGRQAGMLTDPELNGGSRLRGLMEIIVDEECAAQEQSHAAGCMVVHSFMSPESESVTSESRPSWIDT